MHITVNIVATPMLPIATMTAIFLLSLPANHNEQGSKFKLFADEMRLQMKNHSSYLGL